MVGELNSAILVGVANAVMSCSSPERLAENGGTIEFSAEWENVNVKFQIISIYGSTVQGQAIVCYTHHKNAVMAGVNIP